MKPLHFALATVAVIVVGGVVYSTFLDGGAPDETAPAGEGAQWTSSGPVPDFSAGAWGLDNSPDPTQFAKVPGDTGPGPVVQHPDFLYSNESRDTARRVLVTGRAPHFPCRGIFT